MSLAQFERDRADRARRRRARLIAEMAAASASIQRGTRVTYIGPNGPVAMPGDTGTVVGTVSVAPGRIDQTLFEVTWDEGAWLAGSTSCCWPTELEILSAAPEPESYAVAPLGDGWTVVNPDATERIRPKQDWSLVMATLAMVGLNAMPGVAAQFEWVAA